MFPLFCEHAYHTILYKYDPGSTRGGNPYAHHRYAFGEVTSI